MKKPFVDIGPGLNHYENICSFVIESEPVEVYKNLGSKRKCWSVRQRGIVVCHTPYICLENCVFRVQPAGRAKVNKEKRKNVHAYVQGFLINPRDTHNGFLEFPWDMATYNPYKHTTFVCEDGEPVTKSKFCDMFTGDDSEELLVYLPE